LEGYQFSGAMPPEIGSLASLTWLALEGNQLSGAIPLEIGNLRAGLGRQPAQRGHAAGDRQPSEPYGLASDSIQLSGAIPPEIGNHGAGLGGPASSIYIYIYRFSARLGEGERPPGQEGEHRPGRV
jgi:hypothetical protein